MGIFENMKMRKKAVKIFYANPDFFEEKDDVQINSNAIDLLKKGEIDNAIDMFEYNAVANPSLETYNNRIALYLYLNDLDNQTLTEKAREILNNASYIQTLNKKIQATFEFGEENPTKETHLTFVQYLLTLGNDKKVLEYIDKLDEKFLCGEILYIKALILIALEEYETAKTILSSLKDLDKESAVSSLVALLLIDSKIKGVAMAKKQIETMLDSEYLPKYAVYLYSVLLDAEEYDLVGEIFMKNIEQNTPSPHEFYYIAYAYNKLDKGEEVPPILEEILAKNYFPPFVKTVYRTLTQKGENLEELKDFEKPNLKPCYQDSFMLIKE